MAPEQMRASNVDRRVDVYAAGIVLWELLAGRHLFDSDTDAQTMYKVLSAPVEPPSAFVSAISSALDDVVMKALNRDPDERFATAHDFAVALEAAVPGIPRAREVGAWVVAHAGASLEKRAAQVASIDATSGRWEAAIPAPLLATTVEPAADAQTVVEPRARETEARVSATVLYRAPSSPDVPAPPAAVASFVDDGPSVIVPLSPFPRRVVVAVVVGVVLAMGAIALALVLVLVLGRSSAAPAHPAAASASPPAEAPAPTAPPAAAPEETSFEIDDPAVTKSASAAPVATGHPTSVPARPSSCNPPFTTGPDGVKVPKRQCFDAHARGAK
jgi:serine/threonine-protein kinase